MVRFLERGGGVEPSSARLTARRMRSAVNSFGTAPSRPASIKSRAAESSSSLMVATSFTQAFGAAQSIHRFLELQPRRPKPRVRCVRIDAEDPRRFGYADLLDVDQHQDLALPVAQLVEHAIEQVRGLSLRDDLGGT